jgi:integrase
MAGPRKAARRRLQTTQNVEPNKRWWVRPQEKGGKRHEMPAHHKLKQFLDEYLTAAGIGDDDKTPLFRSAAGRSGILTERPMHRVDAYGWFAGAPPRPA